MSLITNPSLATPVDPVTEVLHGHSDWSLSRTRKPEFTGLTPIMATRYA